MPPMRKALLCIAVLAAGVGLWKGFSLSGPSVGRTAKGTASSSLNLVQVGGGSEALALRESFAVARSLHVVDESGADVENCEVEAWTSDGPRNVVRHEPGRWTLPSSECVLSVQAVPFAPHVSRLSAGADAISIVLRRPRSIALLVTLPEGPAPGVRIRARSAIDGDMVAIDSDFARHWCAANHQQRSSLFASLASEQLGPRWALDVLEAKTDKQGWVRRELSTSSVVIEVAGRRIVVCDRLTFTRRNAWSISDPLSIGPEGVSLVLSLQPGSVVRGSVESHQHSAQGHAVLRHELPGGPAVVLQDVEQELDLRDGRFTFEDVIPGPKTVVVTTWPRPDELEFAVAAFAVEPGQDVDLGVLRPESGTLDVELAVVDATTNAVVDVPDARWDLIVGTNPLRGPVLAEGVRGLGPSARLRVRGLPPGLVSVEAKLAQGASLPAGLMLLDTRSLQNEQTVQAAGSVRLQARVCRVATSTIEVAGVVLGAITQGELVDTETGTHMRIGLPLDREAAPQTSLALPQMPRQYKFVVRSDSGATGAMAVGEATIVGGEPVRLALVPAAAARASVRGASGPIQGLRLVLSGADDHRGVLVDANGAASLRGLTPGAAYELQARDKRLRLLPFEGAADGVHRFTAGEAGRTVDLGTLVVRD